MQPKRTKNRSNGTPRWQWLHVDPSCNSVLGSLKHNIWSLLPFLPGEGERQDRCERRPGGTNYIHSTRPHKGAEISVGRALFKQATNDLFSVSHAPSQFHRRFADTWSLAIILDPLPRYLSDLDDGPGDGTRATRTDTYSI